MKTVKYIEISGSATLYSTYNKDTNEYIHQLLDALDPDTLNHLSIEKLKDLSGGKLDLSNPNNSILGGCSWESTTYLHIALGWDDGTVEEKKNPVNVRQITCLDKKDPYDGLLRVESIGGAHQRYIPAEELRFEKFHPSLLCIFNETYDINQEKIETHSHVSYDGIDLNLELIEEYNPRFVEYQIMHKGRKITLCHY